MTYRGYTPAQGEANARYAAKNFKKINIALRLDEDADIIQHWEQARDYGFTSREWLRELYESSAKVEKMLAKYGVQPNIIAKIMLEL